MADPQRVPREDLMDPSVVPQSDRMPEPGVLERFLKPILPSTTPSDYWQGPLYALQHPIDSFNLLKDAVKSDPVGATPVLGNVKRGGQDLREGNYAGAAGEAVAGGLSALGLAHAAPSLEGVTGSVGRGVSAIGRGAEAVGAATRKPALTLGALEGLINDPAKGAMVTGAPYALEYGGRGMQRLGARIEGLGGKPKGPIVDAHMPNTSGYRPDGAFGEPAGNFQPTMADVDPHMPNASGYEPGSHSRNTTLRVGADPMAVDPHMANVSGYDPAGTFGDSAEGLYGSAADEAVSKYMPNSGGAETAAVPRTAVPQTEATGGTMYGGDMRANALAEALSALGDNGGRSTGFFEEGRGGLSDIGSGNFTVHEMPHTAPVPSTIVATGEPDLSWGVGGTQDWTGSRLEPAPSPVPTSLTALQDGPGFGPAAAPAEAAVASDGSPSFTDWAAQMDDIINGAQPSDFPPRSSGFLSNSRPTKADLAGLDMLRRVNGAAGGVR